MAQQNTGLGWSAKVEWLMRTSGEVAHISVFGGADFPDQPIPGNLTSASDVIASGYYFGEADSRSHEYVKCGATAEIPVLVARVGNIALLMAATPCNAIVVHYRASDYHIFNTWNKSISTQDPGTGLYYAEQQVTYDFWQPIIVAPEFSTRDAALAAVDVVNIPFNKTNEGFAVACVAEWYTPEGADLISPVLISTVPEYTIISTNGATPSEDMTTFDFLYQGARFYMSIIGGNTKPITTALPSPDLRQFGASMPVKIFNLIAAESLANIIVGSAPDPYEENAGASMEEGGDGDDQEDDPVEEETLPVPSVAGHGFCTIYVPSSQELGQMAAYLWSGAFDVDQVIKLFSNPMDSILGLSAVPVDLVGTSEQIYLGGVPLTNITMPKYTGRTSVKVDFGTATIDKRWGSYLDYDPYTEFSIYLPFIGIKPLKADDIMEKTISLTYAIDILSGGCVAYIRPAGGSVLYEWSGQCALQIPVTARNYDNVFQTAMSVVGAVGAAVVAPASAPVLSGAVASAAVQAAATKPRIERSGTVNGITGFLGQLRPYLIRTIPEAFIPADQNKFIGYPAYINVNLANVVGYNEVDSIHLENVPATGAELDEIESILRGGVIF